MLSRLMSGGDRRSVPLMVATGLLLLLAVLAACGDTAASLPSGVTGDGQPLALPPLPPRMAQDADDQVAEPVRLRIPAIEVDAPIDPLTVDNNGVLPPPDTNEGTGWWRDGPEPGERGPAVIDGHVDSRQGPAVFFRLTELRSGDQVLVDRADGTTAIFVTQRIEQYDKDEFPTQAVYGDTSDAQLRLITCGGDFDDEDRRYLDNIVVYAIRSG